MKADDDFGVCGEGGWESRMHLTTAESVIAMVNESRPAAGGVMGR